MAPLAGTPAAVNQPRMRASPGGLACNVTFCPRQVNENGILSLAIFQYARLPG